MSASADPVISIVVTCKDRLHHLRQTLPQTMRQSSAEVIVVDYGCSQGTAAWVRENHPSARVVVVTDDPVFCLSRARNLGAAQARGRIFLFLDADIRIDGDLGAWIARNTAQGSYYRATAPIHPSAIGTAICVRADFDRIGRYDEAYRGWGGEDMDLYDTFELAGIPCANFPHSYLVPIEHTDAERQLGRDKGGMDSTEQAARAHLVYRTIKYDVIRLTFVPPDLAARLKLMELVKETVRKLASGSADETISVTLPMLKAQERNGIGKFLVYKLGAPR
jgi:glycosyltransferase involved in cell wall biosynthesis